MADQKNRVITVWAFAKAMVEAGIMTQDEVNRTTHFVINCDPRNGAVEIYSCRVADTRLLDVVMNLNGIEVQRLSTVTDDEIKTIIHNYPDPLLLENYRNEIEKSEGVRTPWAQLLLDEIERRGDADELLSVVPKNEEE